MKAGWKTVKLGEACSFVSRGVSPKYVEDEGILVLNQKCIRNHRVSFDLARRHDSLSKPFNEERLVRAGDVLVNSTGTGTLGRVAQVAEDPPEQATVDSHVSIVRPKKELFHFAYFGYAMILIEPLIAEAGKGSGGQTELSREDLRNNFEIPLPPLAEQKRIVALLDEAFAGIDAAKAKAEDSLNHIQALFESHLQAIFTRRGQGWMERRLGEISRINYGYTESASVKMIGPHFLRITDIQDEGVDWSTVPYCRIDKDDLPKYKLSDGDIVFARTGATTGKSYLVSTPPDSVFASYLIRVQLSEKVLLPGFLHLFFQTRSYWDFIRAGVSGSTQGGFNASKLGELTVPYPASLSDQNVVIRSVSEIQADTLMARKLAKTKLQALAELKASILSQAFAGELTA